MEEEEILAYFDDCGFCDGLGHRLTLCIPFLKLVAAAKGRQPENQI